MTNYKSQFKYKLFFISDQNLTLDAYEYFDHENDTVTLYVQRRYPNNLSDVRQVVYDYRFNQTFVVDSRYFNSLKCNKFSKMV